MIDSDTVGLQTMAEDSRRKQPSSTISPPNVETPEASVLTVAEGQSDVESRAAVIRKNSKASKLTS